MNRRPDAPLFVGAMVCCLLLLGCGGGAAVGTGVSPPPVVAVPAPPVPRLRLPDVARPLRYAVELTVVPDRDLFDGVIDIPLILRERVSQLWLNGSGLKIGAAHVKSGTAQIAARAVPGGEDFVGLSFDQPVGPGEVSLHIAYRGAISAKDNEGLFRQREGGTDYAFTDFEPDDARRVFPCFDEPSYKVPWQLSLRVREGDVAVSNAPALREEPARDGMKIVRFAETQPLPSYLIAFAVGPFDVVDAGSAGKKGTKIRIITPRGKAAEARYAAQTTGQLLTILEGYFQIPYPYEKLDLIAVPLQGGAMENAGLITFRQSLLLSEGRDETVRFQRSFASVAAHELAHQWFGDLVTMAYWDDLWLNESFASWMETKVLMRWRPAWDEDVGDVASRGWAMSADSLVTARRIRQPILDKGDIATAFDGITYGKGSAVLRMFDSYLGPEVFQKGVQIYLGRHAHKNATAADFLRAVSEAAGKDVAPAFSSFLEQPGVPLVSVAMRCERGAAPVVHLSQRRYLPMGSAGKAEGGGRWQVPVCLRHGGGGGPARSCVLLTEPEMDVPLRPGACPDWLLANADSAGYYRVGYSADLLGKLVPGAKGGGAAKGLSLTERVGLIDDVTALMRSGVVPAAQALGLLTAGAGLSGERNRHLLEAGARLAGGVRRFLPDPLVPAHARFLRKVFGARARALGWAARSGEGEDDKLLRPQLIELVGGDGEDPALAAEAGKLARRWLVERASLDADLVPTALHLAARGGDRALFSAYLSSARQAERKDRTRLLHALGSFRDPALLQEALSVTLSKDFDIRESYGLIGAAMSERPNRKAAWAFVQAHFDELVARLPTDSGAHVPRLCAQAFCDPAGRDEMQAFFTGRSTRYTGGGRVLSQVLEGIALCGALRAEQGASLQAFLQKY